MTDQIVVRRYAEVCYEEFGADATPDMALVRDTLEASRELRLCLESPIVPDEKKRAVLESVLADRVSADVLQFVRLLANRRRVGLLHSVAAAYRDLCDERLGRVAVHARVALPFSEADEAAVQRALEAHLGAEVILHVTEEPSLIGGIVLRIGDVVYDGSVTHQLSLLRREVFRLEPQH